MKILTGIAFIAVTAMLNWGSVVYASGAEAPTPPPRMTESSVQGEIVKIDGATYVVKNAGGKEFRIHVDKNTTKLDTDSTPMGRELRVGDRIGAQVGPDGHAALIQMALAAAPRGGRSTDSQDIARMNQEEQQRLQPKQRESESQYPPDFKPEIGGKQKGGAGDFPNPAFPLVKGELVTIEGEWYTLQDIEGKQIRLHVDKTTNLDCGPDAKGTCSFSIGDKVAANRNSVTDPHANEIRRLTQSEAKELAQAVSPVSPAAKDRMKDADVTLSGAKQAVRGEVVKVDGKDYVIKDHHGAEVRVVINQNTRMWCGPESGSLSGMLPNPSASDMPDAKGQPQDQAGTATQPGSDVGPGTKQSASGGGADCVFKAGDKVEAEISDMGAATFIKLAGRGQPGQPLP